MGTLRRSTFETSNGVGRREGIFVVNVMQEKVLVAGAQLFKDIWLDHDDRIHPA
jgi:hypothetical protein